MMEAVGFALIHFESLGRDQLDLSEPLSPKLAVFGDDRSSFVWGFELEKPLESVSIR